MPPTGPLTDREVQGFVNWIRNGAVWPDNQQTLRQPSSRISDEDRAWWAFQPLGHPVVPVDSNDGWSRNTIDRFVHRKLAQHGMRPAPAADPVVLVRRLYFDLIGLPPTPEQIDEFLADDGSHRWERLIDHLLSEPAYGEHWARYWLDLVRYAESDGWKQDAYRPNICAYRDYVVDAFNDDKPYPDFVREQLAGDEIESDDPAALAATGYLRLGIYEYNQRNARAHWNDILNELTDVTGDVFLGMGMACARCHDHKFDPLLQTDYFRLRAFFEPVVWRDEMPYATARQQEVYVARDQAWQAATKDVRQQIDEIVKPYHDRKWKATIDKFPLDIQACILKPAGQRTSWEHQMVYLIERQFSEEGNAPLKAISQKDQRVYERLQMELAKSDHLKPEPLPRLMAVSESGGKISPTVVPGDATGTAVQPGFLSVLDVDAPVAMPTSPTTESSGRRLALASWIGRADNPLTPRVIVNRVWQQHFGQGIVKSVNDFGHLGELPSHPELLDWLALQFVDSGWSLKHLHKLILMSNTWRQSSDHPDASVYEQRDPTESLLWRLRVRRLSAEQIRDAMLCTTGELNQKVGGPSEDSKSMRRALYIKSFRNTPDELLHAFDKANGLKSEPQRNRTTTATQSLLMINGAFTIERAEAFADRLTAGNESSTDQAIDAAFRLAWGRLPDEGERQQALDFVGSHADSASLAAGHDRWIDFCHVLLNSNEFLYVD